MNHIEIKDGEEIIGFISWVISGEIISITNIWVNPNYPKTLALLMIKFRKRFGKGQLVQYDSLVTNLQMNKLCELMRAEVISNTYQFRLP